MNKQNQLDVLDTLFLNIASFTIGLRFHKIEPPFLTEKTFRDRVSFYCYGFITNNPKKIDYWIDFINRDFFETYIKNDQNKHFINIFETPKKNQLLSFYHLSEDHLRLILRSACQELLKTNKGMLFHASASLINNRADIFLGDSGAGKSTIVSLLSKNYTPLADDIIILKKEDTKYFFYQAPFKEKNIWIVKKPDKYPLGKIFFLKKSKKNKIKKINDQKFILNNFLKQFLTDKKDYQKQLPILTGMFKNINNFFILEFSLNDTIGLNKLLSNEKN